MRSERAIKKKMKELDKSANDALKRHLEESKKDDSNYIYLTMYNRICDKIGVLSWVLKTRSDL